MTTEDVLMEYRKRLSIRETARELDIGDALPQGIRISIHTPLTGCDVCGGTITPSDGYFNPRTPHGVRPHVLPIIIHFS